jgi:hypothetical protein
MFTHNLNFERKFKKLSVVNIKDLSTSEIRQIAQCEKNRKNENPEDRNRDCLLDTVSSVVR